VTDEQEFPPEPRITAIAGGCLYSVLLAASVVWLTLRDRIDILQTAAIGRHGVVVALGTGLIVGLAGYGVFAAAMTRLRAVATAAARVREMLGTIGEAPLLALVLIGAVAEEMFFRLAVQDHFGLLGSVATYTVVSTGAMGPRWLPLAAVHATVLGGLMSLGFGLLSTTTANAVMNYLALRRMLVK